MRKPSVLVVILLILLQNIMPATAKSDINFDTPITMTVNKTLVKMDTEPFLYEGTTFVPIRFASEAIGAHWVSWDEGTATASIHYGDKTIQLTKDKNYALVNGQKVSVPAGVKLVSDRVYVPVRFVAEQLDCRVDWVKETYTVNIEKSGVTVPQELVGSRSYTDDEIYWLSKIIHAESRGEPMRGKIAVGNVILNRVASKEYPNTIYGVIFDRKHGVQFSPVLDGSIYHTPYGDSVIAAKRALSGENVAGPSLFFLNPITATNHWIPNSRPFYTAIANHHFYL